MILLSSTLTMRRHAVKDYYKTQASQSLSNTGSMLIILLGERNGVKWKGVSGNGRRKESRLVTADSKKRREGREREKMRGRKNMRERGGEWEGNRREEYEM